MAGSSQAKSVGPGRRCVLGTRGPIVKGACRELVVRVRQLTKAAETLPSCSQDLTQPMCPSHILPPSPNEKRPDREEVEAMTHEEFAERAARRLEEMADRLEAEGKELGIDGEASKITARAQELRVAALLVREEAIAVSAEGPAALADNPPLEAQA